MSGMEKKASFRECPKCGLRNKPTAIQCDFCGQNLTGDDDWQSHVKDLESLTRMDPGKSMDDKVSRRIESTIIRKEANHYKGAEVKEVGSLEEIIRDLDQSDPLKEIEERERRPMPTEHEPKVDVPSDIEPEGPITAPIEPVVVDEVEVSEKDLSEEPEVVEKEETPGTEDIGPVEVAPSIEEEGIAVPDSVVAAEQLAELEPVVSEEPPVKEPEITVSTDSSDSTIRLKLVQVDEGPRSSEDDLVQEAHRPWFKPSGMVAMTTLGLGVVLYLIVLGLIAIGTLDIVSGLSVGAVTSAIIIYGAAVTYSSLRRKDRDEVFICPKCHETVDRCQGNCPACGASFRSED